MRRGGRWLRGRDLGPETHFLTRRVFLILLGAVYLAAFASLWVQIDGLLGSQGITPAAAFLERVNDAQGSDGFWRVPTLLWLWSSDGALHVLCAAGVALALMLAAGIAPRLNAALLWIAYLSCVSVGGIFLRYQWDSLLLETGFLAIWIAPAALRPRAAARTPADPLAVWLLRLLLFKLMFLSGVVKLQSGDPTWSDLTAMQFHYFTQPLPSPASWYAHHLPDWFHRGEVVMTFVIELMAPFLVFAPRRLRWCAFPALAGLQGMIGSTGNYGFFNLLSFALCVLVLDDAVLRCLLPRRFRGAAEPTPRREWGAARVAFAALAAVLWILNVSVVLEKLGIAAFRPSVLVTLQQRIAPLHLVNRYGLFAVMTTQRDEIGLEGSRDGQEWHAYEFRWKPGPPQRAPRFAGLHMPRLDWQLWFASLRGCERAPWFHDFLWKVLRGEEAVLGLLESNPFPAAAPRYLRTPLLRYRFAPPGDSAWWTAEPRGAFCPVVELRGDRLVRVPVS